MATVDIPDNIQFEMKADPTELSLLEKIMAFLNAIYLKVSNFKVEFPSLYKVFGDVKIVNPVRVDNLTDLEQYFKTLEVRLNSLSSQLANLRLNPKQPKIEIPETKINLNPLIESIGEMKEYLSKLKAPQFPDTISINNFPPQKVPNPVTNININPLKGTPKTTAVSVGGTATLLPTTALIKRRTLSLYNASSSETLYIGGTDVTIDNGFPVPPESYSPSIDAGEEMLIYGITSGVDIDIRVFEVNNTLSGR